MLLLCIPINQILFCRLPSVKGHRDLTLGGIQRKVFIPNLAAVKKASVKDE